MSEPLAKCVAALALIVLSGCGASEPVQTRAGPPSVATPPVTPRPNSSMPSPEATADSPAAGTPSPSPISGVALIGFAGLPPGAYPVHLHSACNGSQAFHLAVVSSLLVGGSRTGAIDIPTADTGRGWCLIVYTNASLTRVLATRAI